MSNSTHGLVFLTNLSIVRMSNMENLMMEELTDFAILRNVGDYENISIPTTRPKKSEKFLKSYTCPKT